MIIRNEQARDYKQVEEMTRRAFYNLYVPGCVEHYLVSVMRGHPDFIPELDFVAEIDGRIVGNIMYTKARLVNGRGAQKPILTFGPISVEPAFQRRGIGKALIERSFERALALGYDVVVIFGDPKNYVSRGFKSCARYGVRLENGRYPSAMLVRELVPGALEGESWVYYDSPVMNVPEQDARRYDDGLEKMEKRRQPSQEEFYIMSHSSVEP